MTSDPPQGSLLGPALFNDSLGDMACVTKCTLNGFADSMKLGAVVNTLQGRDAMDRDLDRPKGSYEFQGQM